MQQPQSTSKKRMYITLAALVVVFGLTGFLNYPKAWNFVADKARSVHIGIPDYWDVPFRLGLDLKGGAHLVYEADLSKVPPSQSADALEGARDVIERRVNAFGVAEPLVETAASGGVSRINVELAGVTDVESAIKQIGETPILEFKTPKTAPSVDDKKVTDAANAAVRIQADEALARVKKSGFTATEAPITDFVSKMTGEYSQLATQLEAQKAWKGEVMPAVIETPTEFYVAKVVDIRKTEHEISASHILICFKGADGCTKETTKEEAYAKAKELAAQATAANFGKLASENSTEPGAVKSAGSLNWFFPSTMVTPFATALNAMKVGDITREPVLTNFGYHLIYKSGTHPNVVLPEYKLQTLKFAKSSGTITAADQWDNTDLSGSDLKTASVQFNSQTGDPEVSIVFSDAGAKKFAAITKAWVGKQIAIFLDGEIISAPTVQQEITGGNAQITGRFGIEEAKTLARRLNAGALPIPVKLVSQSTVGPTLGAIDLEKSLNAGFWSFILVALFMILYYRLPGFVSVIALVFYTSVILAIYKLLPVTMSLSGIAGFIVTLGMAVDANILIFERLREELRLGRTLGASIDEGFHRAWSSIWDGHLTTLFAAFVLFYFTSSSIKGFALTLAIGVLMSLFTAITVTRVILKTVVGFNFAKHPWLFGVKK
jgi:protein-export membrane protein SecD